MATNGHDGGARTAKFNVDLASQGHDGPDVPRRADIHVSADANNTLIAIIETGEHGRWSFDLRIDGCVEITRAYDEGMRLDVDELPSWMPPIRRRIEEEIGL